MAAAGLLPDADWVRTGASLSSRVSNWRKSASSVGKVRRQFASFWQRATRAFQAASPAGACVSGMAIDGGTIPFIATARRLLGYLRM